MYGISKHLKITHTIKRKSSCRSNICITHKNINSKEKLLRNVTEILINIKSGL